MRLLALESAVELFCIFLRVRVGTGKTHWVQIDLDLAICVNERFAASQLDDLAHNIDGTVDIGVDVAG